MSPDIFSSLVCKFKYSLLSSLLEHRSNKALFVVAFLGGFDEALIFNVLFGCFFFWRSSISFSIIFFSGVFVKMRTLPFLQPHFCSIRDPAFGYRRTSSGEISWMLFSNVHCDVIGVPGIIVCAEVDGKHFSF